MNPSAYGWPTTTLGDLCDIQIGRTPSRRKPSYWGEGRLWVTISDMNGIDVIHETKEEITQVAVSECGCREVPPGTLLMSFKLSIGKLAFAGAPLFTNEAIAALPIRDLTQLDARFLYYALQTVEFDAASDRAAKGKTLNKSKLKNLPVPLPPLPEQKRIAMVLDKARTVLRKRNDATRLAENFLKTTFLDMFKNPAEKGWPIATVEDMSTKERGSIRTGPFGSQLLHSEFVDEGIAVLGIDNAVANEFRWGGRRYITEEKYEALRRYTACPGDVLITIMGTCGRCAIVPDDIPTAINTKHLCCITTDRDVCMPEYLQFCFLHHPIARQYLTRVTKGAIMDGLNMGLIKKVPIPSAPIDLQRRFARLAEKVTAMRVQLERAEYEADNLFNSLLQRAFRGDV